MKIPVNIKFSSPLNLLKKNLSILLLIFLVFVFFMTALVVFGELKKITLANGSVSVPGKIVRVNLDAHKQLEKGLNDNMTFEPTPVSGTDAFGLAPVKTTTR